MFKVERCNDERGMWSVSHYVPNDPNPTPTQHYFARMTDANADALHRAAKLALLSAALRNNGRPGTESVMFSTGKVSLVTVTDDAGDAYDTAFNASEPDDCD